MHSDGHIAYLMMLVAVIGVDAKDTVFLAEFIAYVVGLRVVLGTGARRVLAFTVVACQHAERNTSVRWAVGGGLGERALGRG